MIMDRNRLMMVAAAVATVVVIAGGFLLGIQPQLHATSTAQSQEDSVVAQNAALTSNLETLKSQFSTLNSLETQLNTKKKSIPDDVSSAAFITELNGIAKSTGVTISNITFGTPAAYVAPVSSTPAATSTTSSTASPSPSASASESATATPVPSASTPASPTVATSPLITASNFSDVPVTMQIQGSYAEALVFLKGLRDGERLFLVTSIVMAKSSGAAAATGDTATSTSPTSTEPTWTFGGLVYALSDSTSTTQTEQSTTAAAAGTATDGSSTDTAAGK